jgi:ABC-2 type transport system permease protein
VAQANPVKHFVFIMRAVLVKGAGLDTVGRPILGLAIGGFAILTLAVHRYRKTTA